MCSGERVSQLKALAHAACSRSAQDSFGACLRAGPSLLGPPLAKRRCSVAARSKHDPGRRSGIARRRLSRVAQRAAQVGALLARQVFARTSGMALSNVEMILLSDGMRLIVRKARSTRTARIAE